MSQDPAVHPRPHQVKVLLGASLAQLPAVWLLAASALVLFALLPKWAMAAWAVYAIVFVAGVVVPAAWPNSRVADLSPFTHVPKLPGADMTWDALGWLSVLVIVALGMGYVGFQRRDIR